jgi:hypothetical protein
MRKYLAELHKKPVHHRKRFAFMASSTITLFILGVWSFSTFGINSGRIADSGSESAISVRTENEEVGPLKSLRMNMAAGIEAIRHSFGELKSSLGDVNFETEYKNMRDGALDIYEK